VASDGRAFIVGPRVTGLRRRLGPTAWVVLEQLLASSTGPTGHCRACVSVRSLAADLAMSKDTVARALARLRSTGTVIPEQRRSAEGTFAAGSYVIAVPDGIALDDAERTPTNSPTPRDRASRRNGSQLALVLDS
jgi:DNA-binding transcriptional MocR family regulator